MKLNILLTLTILCTTGIMSIAQPKIGLTGGYYKSIFFDKSESHYYGQYNSRPTYCVTAFIKIRNHKKINVGSEIYFGSKVLDLYATYGGLGAHIERNDHYNLKYLYASIFPELSIGKKLTFNISIGPAFGFLVNSQLSGSSKYKDMLGNYSNRTYEGSAKSDFKAFELRLLTNIGLEMPFNDKFRLTINNSYSRGISNAAKGVLGSNAEFLSSYDIGLSLGIIYKLDKLHISHPPKPKEHGIAAW